MRNRARLERPVSRRRGAVHHPNRQGRALQVRRARNPDAGSAWVEQRGRDPVVTRWRESTGDHQFTEREDGSGSSKGCDGTKLGSE